MGMPTEKEREMLDRKDFLKLMTNQPTPQAREYLWQMYNDEVKSHEGDYAYSSDVEYFIFNVVIPEVFKSMTISKEKIEKSDDVTQIYFRALNNFIKDKAKELYGIEL